MTRSSLLAAAFAMVTLGAGVARAQDAGAPPPPPPENNPPPPAPTAAAPTPAPAHAAEEKGQMENGFAFETHIYSQIVSFGAGVGTTFNLPLFIGGIFGGYKLDRLVFGLGFNFTSYDAPGSGGAQIVMQWVPGLRYVFVRSSDDRVELFGQADVGFGHSFTSPANEIITADLGIGARYWVHKQFAFSAVGGWTGNWGITQTPDSSTVVQSIFAGLQVLGVF